MKWKVIMNRWIGRGESKGVLYFHYTRYQNMSHAKPFFSFWVRFKLPTMSETRWCQFTIMDITEFCSFDLFFDKLVCTSIQFICIKWYITKSPTNGTLLATNTIYYQILLIAIYLSTLSTGSMKVGSALWNSSLTIFITHKLPYW